MPVFSVAVKPVFNDKKNRPLVRAVYKRKLSLIIVYQSSTFRDMPYSPAGGYRCPWKVLNDRGE